MELYVYYYEHIGREYFKNITLFSTFEKALTHFEKEKQKLKRSNPLEITTNNKELFSGHNEYEEYNLGIDKMEVN